MPEDTPPIRIDPAYAMAQLQKAFAAAGGGTSDRVRKWTSVISGLLDGSLRAGSRTPVAGAPPWVTLQVAHGGFATGELAAGGLHAGSGGRRFLGWTAGRHWLTADGPGGP